MNKLSLVLLILTYFLLTYFPDLGWWLAPLGSLLICLLAKVSFAGQWKDRLGLEMNLRAFLFSLLLMLALYPLFLFFILRVGQYANTVFVPQYRQGHAIYYLHSVAQVFNEEVVLGGLPLLWLRTRMSVRSLSLLATAVAICFAGLHYALYAWSPFIPKPHEQLTLLTLSSLALVGIVRNCLILRARHIGYSLALHLAWNATFFGGFFVRGTSEIGEPERFNLFLGHPLMVASLAVVGGILLFQLRRSTEEEQIITPRRID